jgi:hypothetical protein
MIYAITMQCRMMFAAVLQTAWMHLVNAIAAAACKCLTLLGIIEID